jgi:hypothetical protein
VPDCLDLCPDDSLKTEPATCGCGNEETDSDGDLTPDCNDDCVDDPAKTAPGSCGCGELETDGDGDGTPNCVDGCPNNGNKGSPGVCGCGVADTDTDSDGTPDCVDFCPTNPAKSEQGQCLCSDLKSNPGACGCNVADTDANGNGTADCLDPTGDTQPDEPVIDITRIRQGGRTVYQVLAKLQEFGDGVVYRVTMKGKRTRFNRTVSKGRHVVGFRVLADTYTMKYSVRLGSVSSKETSITFRVPGGRRSSGNSQSSKKKR